MTLFSRLLPIAVIAALGISPLLAAPNPAPAPVTSTPVTSTPALGDTVAQRGNLKLTAEDVRDLVARADPALRAQLLATPAALSEFVRDRLLRQALLDQAKTAGFDQTPEIAQRANDARDTAVVTAYVASLTEPDPSYPSQAEIAAVYENNKSRFLVPREYHIAQIAVRLPVGSSSRADEEAKAKILDIRQQLNKKADFAGMVRKYSDDRASAEKAGDLGWLREDQLLPAVREAVSPLQDNAISEPVRTSEGWHIVKLLGTRPAAVAPLAEVKDGIIQALRQQRAQANARAFVEDMLRKEPIQLNEIEMARSVTKPR